MLAEAALNGVGDAAAAAGQLAGGAPVQPQIPPVPPNPLSWPETRGLNEVLINLGGWAAILKWVFTSVATKIDSRFRDLEVRSKRIDQSLRAVVRELRRLRHAPPLAAYQDAQPRSGGQAQPSKDVPAS